MKYIARSSIQNYRQLGVRVVNRDHFNRNRTDKVSIRTIQRNELHSRIRKGHSCINKTIASCHERNCWHSSHFCSLDTSYRMVKNLLDTWQ